MEQMSELSRREFLKTGAMAVAIVGAGGAGFLSAEPTMADCLPSDDLYRSGNYIVCPDDYNPDRTYSALIRKQKAAPYAETIIDWGQDYTPLDGSRYNSPYDSNYHHLIRVVCEDLPSESLGIDFVDRYTKHETKVYDKCLKDGETIYIPVPAPPKYVTHVGTAGGHQNFSVDILLPDGMPDLNGVSSATYKPVAIVAAHVKYLVYHGHGSRPWSVEDKRNGRAKYVAETPILGVSTSGPQQVSLAELFSGSQRTQKVAHGDITYHFITEVLYDYGDTMRPECRFRAARSEILEVPMTGIHSQRPNP
jgi:hypothetical protein